MSPYEYMLPETWATVNVYVDDSNIAIGGRCHPYSSPTWEYNPKLLCNFVTYKLRISGKPFHKTFYFYGSALSQNAKLRKLRKRRCPYIVAVDCKKGKKKKEKQADTGLVADMAEQAAIAHMSGKLAYFIVLSGDEDMIPGVKKALKYGFQVWVWSWKSRLSKEFQKLAELPKNKDLMHVHLLDYFSDLIAMD